MSGGYFAAGHSSPGPGLRAAPSHTDGSNSNPSLGTGNGNPGSCSDGSRYPRSYRYADAGANEHAGSHRNADHNANFCSLTHCHAYANSNCNASPHQHTQTNPPAALRPGHGF